MDDICVMCGEPLAAEGTWVCPACQRDPMRLTHKRKVLRDILGNYPCTIMYRCASWGVAADPADTYLGSIKNSDYTGGVVWKKLCTTKVADVPKTRIELPNISPEFTTGYIEFEVFNGVCYMALFNLTFVNTSTGNLVVNIPGIPKRKSDGWHTITNVVSLKSLVVNIGANGGAIEFYTAREVGTSYYGTFSYLVAES